jgi:hypothetical protein
MMLLTEEAMGDTRYILEREKSRMRKDGCFHEMV